MKKLLLVTLICLIAVAMFAGTPRSYTQKVATSTDGELPFVTNPSTSTAPDYLCQSWITTRPGEVLATNTHPATTIRLYRFGNGTTIPYITAFYLQLGTFPTQWVAGDVIHTVITYIPGGTSVAWDMTIPAGTAAITYRLPTDPIPAVTFDPIPAAPVPDPAVYLAPANMATGLGYAGQTLSWQPAVTGGEPTGYMVYFGTDNPPMAMVGDQVTTTLATGVLAQNTTYYWQIVPYNAEGPAVGNPVWSFTTRGEINPNPAENPIPANGASFASPVPGGFVQTLFWSAPSTGVVPTGYKLAYMGVPPIDIGNVLSTDVLINGPGVITWQIIPYYIDGGMRKVDMKPIEATFGSNRTSGVRGDAVGCPVWSFTVTPYVAPSYTFDVTSAPAGAAIWVDGVDSGLVTPHTFNMVEGSSALYSVQMAGYTWMPVDYQVTNIMANGSVNFVGTLITYPVDVFSNPAGAAILVNGVPSGFVTPHTFNQGYGTSAVYSVQLPQYTWMPVDFAVNNIMAPANVTFEGTYVPNMYQFTVTSAPAGAAIYVGGVDSGFITPHVFDMMEGASALYSVMMPGYTWMPADYQVTNIMANGSVNFVGTLITFPVDVFSAPAGAAIYVDGVNSTFVTPHTFIMTYGTSATYSVQMPGYTWMPVDYAVTNIVAPIPPINFMGTIIQYPVDITSTPAGAAIYVDAMDSGFVTPHTFMMDYNTSATYSVMLAGYIFTPVSFVVTGIMAPAAQNFVGMGVDGMIEPGIPEYMTPPAGVGIPGVVFLDDITTGFNIDYFIYMISEMPILPMNPGCTNDNTFGVVLSHTGGMVDMQVQVPAGIWYVTGYWGGMWHEAVAYPYMNTVPGYVTLFGIDFGARADVPIYISQMNPNVPVTLSDFFAAVTASNFVSLTWVTETETGVLGYNIYRAENNNVENADKINLNMVDPTNTSQQHSYNYVDEDVQVNNTYYYWLESVDLTGINTMYGPVNVSITGGTTPELPEVSLLSNAYPNPFRAGGSTTISVEVKEGETGTVTVYNLLGQAVKTYRVTEGQHNLTWNATGCASGIYFYRLSTPTTNATKKLVIVN